MIIESLVVKKNSSNCFIKIDDARQFTFSMDLVLKYQLNKGKELSESVLNILCDEQDAINAKQVAYNYVAYKPRTEMQVLTKLKDKNYADRYIFSAIEHLKKLNLLDDRKFAFGFATEYSTRNKAGKYRVYNELKRRGISDDLANEAIDASFDKIDELELARSAATKKLRLLEGKPRDKKYRSLRDFLLRKGFNSEIVRNIVNQMIE